MYCRECQGLRPESHVYCYICGAALSDVKLPRPTKTVICQVCGEAWPHDGTGRRYCPACGENRQRERVREAVRRCNWRKAHGCEPPPRPEKCAICGRRLPEDKNANTRYCSGFCQRVARAEAQRVYYYRKQGRTPELAAAGIGGAC